MIVTGAPQRWTRRAALLGAAGAVTAFTTAAVLPADAGGRAGSRGIHLIGDSWAAGLHADPSRALGQVAAAALGAPITVDAVSGTGYLNDAGALTYLQRARAASTGGDERLVIVQGGSNDDDQDVNALAPAVTSTIRELQLRFPYGTVLLVGPGPDPAPVTEQQHLIDRTIGAAAAACGVTYISMLHERWIPDEHVDAVIDPGNDHPTVQGQQYLGLRLAAAVRLLLPGLLTD